MTLLITLTLGWIAGIVAAWWLLPPLMLLPWPALPLLAGLILYHNDPRLRQWLLVGLAMVLGAVRMVLAQPVITPAHIAWYNDSGKVLLTGVVIAEPDIRDTYTNLRLQAQQISRDNAPPIPVAGLLLVKASNFPAYHYGDQLEIFARLETPPDFEDFSYKDYLARQGVHSFMRQPQIKLVQAQHGFSVRTQIYRFKERAHQIINRCLPEPQASLLNGILLGIQSGISSVLYNEFNITGSSHVIVISGSNISLVVGILLLAGQKMLGKRNAAFLAMAGIVLYTVMVGAGAAVVRAALMGGLYVLALYTGRPAMALNSLVASALIMTIVNPLVITDVGFQLSFTATLGLIVLVPILETWAARLPGQFLATDATVSPLTALLNEALLVTLAAQIITTPLIIYHFGRFSLISLLTNLLIVPVQPLVMLFGALTTVAGLVWLPLGQLLGWLAWLPLTWTIAVVEWTAGFSWAQLQFAAMPLWLLTLAYLALAGVVWQAQKSITKKSATVAGKQSNPTVLYLLGVVAATALLAWGIISALPDGNLHVAFLDVGQGDAILVTAPNGRQLLIDGGPSPAQLGIQLGRHMAFWDHSLDMVVSTHPDSDHLTGLVDTIKRYHVDTALISDVPGDSALAAAWRQQLTAIAIPVITAWQGMTLSLDPAITITVLNPGPACASMPSANDHSVALKIQQGTISFLLTGDMEAPVEQVLAASKEPVQATVFKSPHHGSKTGSDPAFLAAVNPQIVVISVGADNKFGHPAPEILQRYADSGITVLRTDQQGTIEFITNGSRLWLNNR